MSIAFNTIPLVINTPGSYIEFDSSRAVRGLQLQPHNVLLVGNQLTSGSVATAGSVYPIPSEASALALFGAHSQLYEMVKAYKAVDRLTPVWAIPLTDLVGGAKAVHKFTIVGTATASGSIAFYIAGRRFTISVAVSDTASALVTAAVAAAAALTDLPVVCIDGNGDIVECTAVHKGVFGNQIKLGVNLMVNESMPAGITVTITQGTTAGSGDSDHATAVTGMGEDQYNTVVCGCYTTTEIAKLVTEMESRESAMRCIEGVLFGAVCDTTANLATYAGSFNSSVLCMSGYETSALCLTPWEVAAQIAAINAASVQVDPARHQCGTSLSNAYAAARGTRFTRAQRDTLLGLGVSTLKANDSGGMCVERLVTTKITTSGLSDLALFDLSPTVRTLHAIRYTIRARIASKFANFKLADDDGIPRPKVATPSVVRAELVALFWEWFFSGWVENPDQYMADLLVERDSSDPNRVNAIVPPDIINSFLVFAGQISFIR